MEKRYSHVGQALHWLTAIVVLVAFIYGPGGGEERVYLPRRDPARQLHETLGLCVFLLAFLRLAYRRFGDRPQAPASTPAWMDTGARLVQLAMLALLFLLPLTAIVGAWMEGHPLTLLGGWSIAPPFAPSHSLGSVIAELHTWLGDAIMWLAGLHAFAALFHHFVLRDGVLATMLPRWLVR